MAIVQLVQDFQTSDNCLEECIEKFLVIIELKFKASSVIDAFYDDIQKLHEYSKIYPDCQLYAVFIHEECYNDTDCFWFDKRQTNNWAKGRVTELVGYWNEVNGEFVTDVMSY